MLLNPMKRLSEVPNSHTMLPCKARRTSHALFL